MTTHAFEGIGHNWGEVGVRPAKAIMHLGGQALTAISHSNVAFEAFMTRKTLSQPYLELAAHRGELPPAVRDRLLAQGAIKSLLDD